MKISSKYQSSKQQKFCFCQHWDRLTLIAQVIHINSESWKQPQKHNTKAQRLISDTYTLMWNELNNTLLEICDAEHGQTG